MGANGAPLCPWGAEGVPLRGAEKGVPLRGAEGVTLSPCTSGEEGDCRVVALCARMCAAIAGTRAKWLRAIVCLWRTRCKNSAPYACTDKQRTEIYAQSHGR